MLLLLPSRGAPVEEIAGRRRPAQPGHVVQAAPHHPRAALLLHELPQPSEAMLGVSAGLQPYFDVQVHPTAEGALGEEEEQTKPGRSSPGEGGRQAGVWQRYRQAVLLHQVGSFETA